MLRCSCARLEKMNEYIDVERLHAVIEGKLVGRGSGQSFARLVQLAQSIEFLPFGKLAYIGANETDARAAAKDLLTIMTCLGMGDWNTHLTRDKLGFENQCQVLFLSASSSEKLERSLRGVRLDNYFVDHFAEYLINDQLHGFLQTRLM